MFMHRLYFTYPLYAMAAIYFGNTIPCSQANFIRQDFVPRHAPAGSNSGMKRTDIRRYISCLRRATMIIQSVSRLAQTEIATFTHSVHSPGVLVGALVGAAIFALYLSDVPLIKSVILFAISMLAGVVAAPFAAQVVSSITPESVTAREPVGALVSSAVVVKLLTTVSNNVGTIFRHNKGETTK